jgi:phosphate:Na+ symporter
MPADGGSVSSNCCSQQVIRSIRDSDEQAAADVIAVKDDIRRLADEALVRQSQRIGVAETRNIELIRLEFEVLDNLRRIYTLAKRIAKDFVPEEVAEKA